MAEETNECEFNRVILNESNFYTQPKADTINEVQDGNKTIETEFLEEFLAKHSLSTFADKMRESGITEVQHLEDVDENDAVSDFGMSKFQARRLLRAFHEWKLVKTKGGVPYINAPSLITNSKAVVVTLPPAFQGFFGTSDGGKSVIVSSKMLERKWDVLWYEKPLNPFQNASNSFILKMCESKQYMFRTQRECEAWARKERERRIELLLAVERNTKGWTAYYMKKSIYGNISILQEKYPVVAVLVEDNVCKADYESCALYKDKIDELNMMLLKHEENFKSANSSILTSNGTVKKGKV